MNRPDTRVRTFFRLSFVLYTVALLVATHWPGAVVHGPIERTDLLVHGGVFFVWTCLLWSTRWVGVGTGLGGCGCLKRRLVWTCVCGLVFAVFDETTQPIFSRVFDVFDVLADWFGVLMGCLVVWVWGKVSRSQSDRVIRT